MSNPVVLILFLWVSVYGLVPALCDDAEDGAKSPLEDDYQPEKKYPTTFFEALPSCMSSSLRLSRAYELEGVLMATLQKKMLWREMNSSHYYEMDSDIELKSLMKRISRSRLLENSTKASENLIDTLRFTRRVSLFTNHIIQLLHHHGTEHNVGFYTNVFNQFRRFIINIGCWVTSNDHNTAMLNFLRVVRIYNLPKSQVVEGAIFNTKTKTPLSPKELNYILLKAHDLNAFEDIVSWSKFLMEQSYKELEDEGTTRTIKRLHHNALFKSGKVKEAIEFLEKLKEDGFQDKKLDRHLSFYRDFQNSERSSSEVEKTKTKEESSFEALCSTEDYSASSARDKFCKWLWPNSGWARFKLEIFSRLPFVCQVHDVINANDTKLLRRAAKTHMLVNSKYDPIAHRNLMAIDNAFTLEEPVARAPILRLRKRLSWVTGLDVSTKSAMDFKVETEPLGGAFRPNTDFHKHERWMNEGLPHDVMASAAFQLAEHFSDTKIAFPKAEVVVKNKPGAVILWFNLRRSGSPEPKSQHAVCPVPLGITWTAKLKILTNNHWQKRPCGLHKKH